MAWAWTWTFFVAGAVELEVGQLTPGRPLMAQVTEATGPTQLLAGPVLAPCGPYPSCLDPGRSRVLGDFPLDGAGRGALTLDVPADLAMTQVGFQAFTPSTGEVSPVALRPALVQRVGDLVVRDAAGLERLQRTQAVLTPEGLPATITFEPGAYGPVADLPALQVGNLVLRRGLDLRAPLLQEADRIEVDGALSEVLLDLPLLAQVDELVGVGARAGLTLDAPSLLEAGSLRFEGNTGSVDLHLAALEEVAEDVVLSDNLGVLTVDAASMVRIGGQLRATRNARLAQLTAPSLEQAGQLMVAQNDELTTLGPFAGSLQVGRGDCATAGEVQGNRLLRAFEGSPPTFRGPLDVSRNDDLGVCVARTWFEGHRWAASCEDNRGDLCSFWDGPCGTGGAVEASGYPPSPPSLSLAPAAPRPRERTQCVIAREAVDLEGLAVSYRFQWTLDGRLYSGPLETTTWPGDTLPAGLTAPGQDWTCEVVPSDCRLDGFRARTSFVPEMPPTNVLLLLLDDVGTDKISWYGEHPDPPWTPSMDAFLDEAVVFDGAVVAPSCSPTRAMLLTGRQPRRTGVGNAINFDVDAYELALSEQSLPEVLRSAPEPWTSVLIGKWHLSSMLLPGFSTHPLSTGFDRFVGVDSNMYETATPLPGAGYELYQLNTDGVYETRTTYLTVQQVDDALAEIERVGEPFFLNLSFSAAHLPWELPPEELYPRDGLLPPIGRDVRMQAMVEVLDAEIGRLMASIDPEVLERTTVVLLSDNGTAGDVIAPPWDPLRGKLTQFQGGVRVPFGVRGPLVAEPGRRVVAPVHAVDLFPTVMDIAGVSPSVAAREIDGQSLLPYLYDPQQAPLRDYNFNDRFSPNGPGPYTEFEVTMVTDGRYKLIRDAGVDQLYELSSWWDDGEDLLAGAPDGLQTAAWYRLSAEMDRQLARQRYLE